MGLYELGLDPADLLAADEAGSERSVRLCDAGAAQAAGSSGRRRAGSNGDRSTVRARPSAISSAIASPVAGAFRMPQTLWPVAT